MANTSDRPISVDGVRLDTLAWNVEKVTRETAARRANDVSLALLDGAIPSLNDGLEPLTFGLAMWLRGTDVDGGVPAAGSRTVFRNNLDELLHLFGKRHALLEVIEQVGGGSEATNLLGNPGYEIAGGWASNNNATEAVTADTVVFRAGTRSARSTKASGASITLASMYGVGHSYSAAGSPPVVPGRTYLAGCWMRAGQAGYRGQVSVSFADAAFTAVGANILGPFVTLPATTWTWVSMTVKAPAGATLARVGAVVQTSNAVASTVGHFVNIDDAIFTEDLTATDSFNGATPEDATHRYAWTGTANASASLRIPKARRRALAKVSAAIAPDENSTGSQGTFSVALTVPSGVWEDELSSDFTKTGTSQVASEVTTLTGATERVNDAIILVTGPVNTPRVTDPATGMWVELTGNLSAGQFWRINSATWASRTGAGLSLSSPDTTGTDSSAVTVVGGPSRPYVLPLVPIRDTGARRVRVTLSGTSMTAATAISIRARRKYA